MKKIIKTNLLCFIALLATFLLVSCETTSSPNSSIYSVESGKVSRIDSLDSITISDIDFIKDQFILNPKRYTINVDSKQVNKYLFQNDDGDFVFSIEDADVPIEIKAEAISFQNSLLEDFPGNIKSIYSPKPYTKSEFELGYTKDGGKIYVLHYAMGTIKKSLEFKLKNFIEKARLAGYEVTANDFFELGGKPEKYYVFALQAVPVTQFAKGLDNPTSQLVLIYSIEGIKLPFDDYKDEILAEALKYFGTNYKFN